MRHVKLDTEEDAVKRFVMALTADAGPSVLELDGKPVAVVVPPAKTKKSVASQEWTTAKNSRRCDLVDREIDGTLTPAEAVELEQLQDEMLRYRQRVAPLPLAHARKMHNDLLNLAASAKRKA
jgi:hypothetical protein